MEVGKSETIAICYRDFLLEGNFIDTVTKYVTFII